MTKNQLESSLPITLEKTEKVTPYPYFKGLANLSKGKLQEILQWLETEEIWKRINADFYNQYEFSLLDVALPSNIEFLAGETFVNSLVNYAESYFQTHLQDKVDVVAHKLVSGDTIKIHNDYIKDHESHRILFQFNRDWDTKNGGFLMTFTDSNPESIYEVISPEHGSVFGFEISEKSHHAVSTVHTGLRFTIVYSFYKK